MSTSFPPDTDGTPNATGQRLVCGKCKTVMDTRVPRGALVWTFLFWLPLARYKCYRCMRKQYVLIRE